VDFESFLSVAKTFSLVAVCITFTLIVVYALWPSLQGKFDEAASLPLKED
jgi:cytochrome c oxidase cbb3-type subunit 4